jgi:hypothetical protein
VSLALTVAVLGFIGFRLASATRFTLRDGRRTALEIVQGIRLRHVWPVPIVLGLVVAAASALLQVPGLDFGWWALLGGQGNPVLGSTDQTAGTFLEWLVPAVFLVLLAPAVPLLALREEEMFRLGAEDWSNRRRAARAVQFGLIHALIGIPIGVALALSIGGAYFTLVYLRGYRRSRGDRRTACLESGRAHTVYNVTIVTLVAVLLVTGQL